MYQIKDCSARCEIFGLPQPTFYWPGGILKFVEKKRHMTDFTKWSDNSSINPEPDVNWDSVISKAVKLSHLTNANFTLTLIKNGQQAD